MSNKRLQKAARYKKKDPERFMGIQHILFMEWDVCGVNLNFSCHDEYECYVPSIMDVLDTPNITADDIEKQLHKCLEEGWGDVLTGQHDKECRDAALTIMGSYGPYFEKAKPRAFEDRLKDIEHNYLNWLKKLIKRCKKRVADETDRLTDYEVDIHVMALDKDMNLLYKDWIPTKLYEDGEDWDRDDIKSRLEFDVFHSQEQGCDVPNRRDEVAELRIEVELRDQFGAPEGNDDEAMHKLLTANLKDHLKAQELAPVNPWTNPAMMTDYFLAEDDPDYNTFPDSSFTTPSDYMIVKEPLLSRIDGLCGEIVSRTTMRFKV